MQLTPEDVEQERVAKLVVGCSQLALRRLGPGRTRAAYVDALVDELVRRRVPFQRDVKIPVVHRGIRLDAGHLIELCVLGTVMVDVLTVGSVQVLHCIALRRRLLVTGVPLGLVTTFGSARLVLSRVIVRHAGAFCLSEQTSKNADAEQSPSRGSPAEPPC
ncbi:MAG TPA: GxxExxY protein [Polyangiaceae bacterium]|nr:GxxExxY protein [Polyangiaceae bacterium]